MNNNSINKNSTIGRDNIGRDMHKHIHYHENNTSPLETLNKKLAEEIAKNITCSEIIEELKRFREQNRTDLRSLEEKLGSSKYTALIKIAKEFKETISKKIARDIYLPSAQKMYVQLLAIIKTDFTHKVQPYFADIDPIDMGKVLMVEIVEPLYAKLGENTLGISQEHLCGMVYYLTGNCHIDWS